MQRWRSPIPLSSYQHAEVHLSGTGGAGGAHASSWRWTRAAAAGTAASIASSDASTTLAPNEQDETAEQDPSLWSQFRSFCTDTTPVKLPFPDARSVAMMRLRDLIISPILEEIAFRALPIAILTAGGFGPRTVLLLGPLIFGVAHAHHGWNHVRAHGMPVSKAVIAVLVQVAYSFVFGVFASYLFLRTGHLMACILPHMFCNALGLPSVDFWFDRTDSLHPRRVPLLLLYLVGIVLFYLALGPLTAPALYDGIYWSASA